MNTDEFREFIRHVQQGQASQIDEPSSLHMSFIPEEQRSNSLLMVSQAPSRQDMPTAFIGSVRKNYTPAMWNEDVKKWKSHFGPNQEFYEIPLMPVIINNQVFDVMDSSDAIPKIETALRAVNQLPVGEKIRLVCLGTGHSHFLYEAIAYLLNQWRDPTGNLRPNDGKHVQFITSGDTKDTDMSNFCQWLCISGKCHVIEFYNTMLYHPFGYYSSDYPIRR